MQHSLSVFASSVYKYCTQEAAVLVVAQRVSADGDYYNCKSRKAVNESDHSSESFIEIIIIPSAQPVLRVALVPSSIAVRSIYSLSRSKTCGRLAIICGTVNQFSPSGYKNKQKITNRNKIPRYIQQYLGVHGIAASPTK